METWSEPSEGNFKNKWVLKDLELDGAIGIISKSLAFQIKKLRPRERLFKRFSKTRSYLKELPFALRKE